MHKRQAGFTPLYAVIILAVIVMIGGVGLLVFHKEKSQSSSTSSNTSSQSNDGSYVSLDAYIEKLSTTERIHAIMKSLGTLRDCGTISADGTSSTINGCFESAFKQCKPVAAIASSSASNVITRYVIVGRDTKTSHCIGGYYYTAPDDPAYKGLGTFCALDTSVQPFLEAMSRADSGNSDKQIETQCKQPANPRHL